MDLASIDVSKIYEVGEGESLPDEIVRGASVYIKRQEPIVYTQDKQVTDEKTGKIKWVLTYKSGGEFYYSKDERFFSRIATYLTIASVIVTCSGIIFFVVG
jgi:hypothetical protein